MCRYAMYSYKQHYACFSCRKTFKRRLLVDIDRDKAYNNEGSIAKCPDCGNEMANMGLDFEAPKKKGIKAWRHLENLYQVGITFHSCGCNGPGYIPIDLKELILQFEETKHTYIEHRRFWLSYKKPEYKRTVSEAQKDFNENSNYYYRLPSELRTGKQIYQIFQIDKAIAYWTNNINKIEKQIAFVKSKTE